MGDFNAEPADTFTSDFYEIYNLKNIIREKTCFKNPNNPSCIDLIITTRPKSVQNFMFIYVYLDIYLCLFDFHKMYITVMEMCYSQ